jgi:hypothetical protein
MQHDPGKANPMTRREIVLLASRVVAVIQVITAILDATQLPQTLTELFHDLALRAASPSAAYWSRYETEVVLSIVLRIFITLFAAWLFWQCGPKIERFLLPAASGHRDSAQSA